MKISRSQSSRYEAPQHADDGEYGVPVVSIGDWMLTTLILMIPLVNLVMILVWTIGIGGTNPSKANFFRAILIWFVIIAALGVISALVLGKSAGM